MNNKINHYFETQTVLPDPKTCDPLGACWEHGRCWTHSCEDPRDNETYTEWDYERKLEDIRAMEKDYQTGEFAVGEWDARYVYADYSENDNPNIPF